MNPKSWLLSSALCVGCVPKSDIIDLPDGVETWMLVERQSNQYRLFGGTVDESGSRLSDAEEAWVLGYSQSATDLGIVSSQAIQTSGDPKHCGRLQPSSITHIQDGQTQNEATLSALVSEALIADPFETCTCKRFTAERVPLFLNGEEVFDNNILDSAWIDGHAVLTLTHQLRNALYVVHDSQLTPFTGCTPQAFLWSITALEGPRVLVGLELDGALGAIVEWELDVRSATCQVIRQVAALSSPVAIVRSNPQGTEIAATLVETIDPVTTTSIATSFGGPFEPRMGYPTEFERLPDGHKSADPDPFLKWLGPGKFAATDRQTPWISIMTPDEVDYNEVPNPDGIRVVSDIPGTGLIAGSSEGRLFRQEGRAWKLVQNLAGKRIGGIFPWPNGYLVFQDGGTTTQVDLEQGPCPATELPVGINSPPTRIHFIPETGDYLLADAIAGERATPMGMVFVRPVD